MLNGFQQKVAGIAILCVSICAIGGFAIAVFKILGAFLDKFGAVIWPLALAVILSFILKPAVDFMADRLRVGRTAACWIMMAFLVVVITGGWWRFCRRSYRRYARLRRRCPICFRRRRRAWWSIFPS